MAQWLSDHLGQQVVIENRGGAGGNIATQAVINAAPDGYTVLLVPTASAINATLYESLPYNFLRDIAPVAGLVRSPNVMEVNLAVPAKTVAEFIAYAKANPRKINMASPGVGTSVHLSGELFMVMTGVQLTHVPYRGSAPALTDLMGGHVAIYFSSLPPAIGLARDGRVRALAVTGTKRSDVLPDLPTVAEAGLPGYESVLHYGIVAPAGTPRPIIDKLNAALRDALDAADTKERMAADGTEPLPSTPDEYAADIDREETKWSAIVRKSGAKAE